MRTVRSFTCKPTVLAVCLLLSAANVFAQDWVAKSNENAQVLLEVFAKASPETAGRFGVPGLDEEIFDLAPGFNERQMEATRAAIAVLGQRLATESHPAIRQDLEIMIASAEEHVEGTELAMRTQIPFIDVSQTVFYGLKGLLDDQVDATRRSAALVRLRKYAGLMDGFVPVADLAKQHTRERMQVEGLLGPVKAEVEKELGNGATYLAGIEELFKKYEIEGYQEAYGSWKNRLPTTRPFCAKNCCRWRARIFDCRKKSMLST